MMLEMGPFLDLMETFSMGEKAWLAAVECGNLGALHTYCFSVGRLPEDITIRMFP